MTRKFTLKEIAFQAGLSLATVDRALHGRAHVRSVTSDRVNAALAELERQYATSQLSGRRFTIDILMQSPARFSSVVRAAFEAELPLVKPASFRARFHLVEVMDEREIVGRLFSIARRGSHGIMLKVPATPAIEHCLAELNSRKIPVVTYVTDVAEPLRLGYVGIKNRRAGATAASLMHPMIKNPGSRVLITLSSQMFQGEEKRRVGFLDYLKIHAPQLSTITVTEGHGVNTSTKKLVAQALENHPDIHNIYSIGGGNSAILEAFAKAERPIDVFAAHDLDATNRQLLEKRQLSFVIHHNFRQDARRVSLHFSKYHRMVPQDVEIEQTDINIACPVGQIG